MKQRTVRQDSQLAPTHTGANWQQSKEITCQSLSCPRNLLKIFLHNWNVHYMIYKIQQLLWAHGFASHAHYISVSFSLILSHRHCCVFSSCCQIEILCEFIIVRTRATYLVHLYLLGMIALILLCDSTNYEDTTGNPCCLSLSVSLFAIRTSALPAKANKRLSPIHSASLSVC